MQYCMKAYDMMLGMLTLDIGKVNVELEMFSFKLILLCIPSFIATRYFTTILVFAIVNLRLPYLLRFG